MKIYLLRRLPGDLLDRGHGCGEILHVAGHDQLGGLAVSDLLHGLHAAQGQIVVVGVRLVDLRMASACAFWTVSRASASPRPRGCAAALRPRRADGGLLFALGAGDGSLLFALGQQDGGALLAVRLHLFLHGLADLHRRLDVFQLDAVDLDAPAVRGLVKAGGDLRVDEVAARQVSSSVIEPMMSRSVVADRFSMAWIGRFTP